MINISRSDKVLMQRSLHKRSRQVRHRARIHMTGLFNLLLLYHLTSTKTDALLSPVVVSCHFSCY